MKEKINKYFSMFLDEPNVTVDECEDVVVWCAEKMKTMEDEDSIFDASRAYLFMFLQMDEETRVALKTVLHQQPQIEGNCFAVEFLSAISEMLIAKETKEIMAHAKHGVNCVLWYLYGKGATTLRNLLRYMRDEEAAETQLAAFMVSALKLLISVLQHDFPFIKSASLEADESGFEIKNKKLTPYAAALVARAMHLERIYTPAMPYAKYALCVSDPAETMEAFNTYGFCALNLRDYQLVYDIFYSWLNKKMVGRLSDIPKTFSEKDARWRSENERKQAIMYGNMAYTCSVISRLLLPEDKKGVQFRKAALGYVKIAISFEPSQEVLYRTYAELFYDEGEYIKALGLFKRSKQYAKRKFRKLLMMQRSVGVQLELLCRENCWNKSFLEECLQKKDSNNAITSVLQDIEILRTERQSWNEKDPRNKEEALSFGDFLVEILDIGQKVEFLAADGDKKVNNLLAGIMLCIYNTVTLIRQQLRCQNYIKRHFYLRNEEENTQEEAPREQIAYYTSMENLQFLLHKVYCDSNCERPVSLDEYKKKHSDSEEAKLAEMEAKNCFTMMHAYYMNDPNEGLTLVNELAEEIGENGDLPNLIFRKLPPVVFRERLYDNQFVFLKSFTNLVDQLNMWSMYASDRSEGSDSNGCCVCIAPETFDMMTHNLSDSSQLAYHASNYWDDYQLYKVAYVQNGNIVEASEQLKDYYRKLKEQFVLLNYVLCQYKPRSSSDMEAIQSILQQSLAPIAFLFKDASYRAEQERRIVIIKKKERLEQISKTAQIPPKLFINPYHQVYAEQLILGPKTKDPDYWIPYLQYELTKMWQSWPKVQYGERKPIVRKSSIHYRD